MSNFNDFHTKSNEQILIALRGDYFLY